MLVDGIINVLKPPGMTSSDIVVYLRKTLKIKKIGHAGTLDPGASGVLVLCLGKATKLAEYIMAEDKSYRGGMILGSETDTLDADGTIVRQSPQIPDFPQIKKAFAKYRGTLLQHPPMYSARKHKGKRLYELARKGQRVEVPPREVKIFQNDIIEFIPPNQVSYEVKCTKGTYIRSLVRDIGRELGCGAYLSYLVRTQSGAFSIHDSHTLQEITQAYTSDKMDEILKPMGSVLPSFKEIVLDSRVLDRILNGNILGLDSIISDINLISNLDHKELVKVYCNNRFIGLGYVNKNNMIQMRKVLV